MAKPRFIAGRSQRTQVMKGHVRQEASPQYATMPRKMTGSTRRTQHQERKIGLEPGLHGVVSAIRSGESFVDNPVSGAKSGPL